MQIKCPKCGFEQPQDRFCASCGINMESYKPQVSFGSRLAANSLFYVILIGIVISATVIFLKQQMRPRALPDEVVAESAVESRPLNDKPQHEVLALDGGTPQPSPTTSATTTPTAAAAVAVAASPTAALAAAPAAATTALMNAAASLAARPVLRIYMVEAQPEFIRDLSNDKVERGDSDHGVLPDFRSHLAEARRRNSAKILEEATAHNLPQPDQPLIVFKGTKDPKLKEPVGLFIQVLPSAAEERGTPLRIEAKRVLPSLPAGAENPVADSQTVTREFIVPDKAAAFFSGLLPHRRKPLEWEHETYKAENFLNVLLADRFQEGVTEFVIFFEIAVNRN